MNSRFRDADVTQMVLLPDFDGPCLAGLKRSGVSSGLSPATALTLVPSGAGGIPWVTRTLAVPRVDGASWISEDAEGAAGVRGSSRPAWPLVGWAIAGGGERFG